VAGLSRGYEAASYWYSRDLLANYGAIPKAGRIVIDRNRATGGGMTARATEIVKGLMPLASAPTEPLVAAPVSR